MHNEESMFNYIFKTCPVCGENFICRDKKAWSFKRNGHLICSWHCLRKFDSMSAAEQKKIIDAATKKRKKANNNEGKN